MGVARSFWRRRSWDLASYIISDQSQMIGHGVISSGASQMVEVSSILFYGSSLAALLKLKSRPLSVRKGSVYHIQALSIEACQVIASTSPTTPPSTNRCWKMSKAEQLGVNPFRPRCDADQGQQHQGRRQPSEEPCGGRTVAFDRYPSFYYILFCIPPTSTPNRFSPNATGDPNKCAMLVWFHSTFESQRRRHACLVSI